MQTIIGHAGIDIVRERRKAKKLVVSSVLDVNIVEPVCRQRQNMLCSCEFHVSITMSTRQRAKRDIPFAWLVVHGGDSKGNESDRRQG